MFYKLDNNWVLLSSIEVVCWGPGNEEFNIPGYTTVITRNARLEVNDPDGKIRDELVELVSKIHMPTIQAY